MSTTSKWARRLIKAAPPQLKRWIGSNLPGIGRQITDHAYNQLDQVRLKQFAQAQAGKLAIPEAHDRSLAVVMPCYNHAFYLDATFTSLFGQTHRPFEIVCVDDRSTDDTWVRLHQFVAQAPPGIKVTLMQTPRNVGQAAAINLAVRMSSATILTIVNDDDYLMHDALDAISTLLAHRPDLALLGAEARPFRGTGCPPGSDAEKRIASSYPEYAGMPLVEYRPSEVLKFTHPNQLNMTHSGTTFYRHVWQSAGGYYADKEKRITIFADRDFQIRVAALFPVAVSITVPFVYWRDGSSVDSGLYS